LISKQCLDNQGNAQDYRYLHQGYIDASENETSSSPVTSKFLCNYYNDTWNPAATNFDNVLEGFWTLSQVVTFNGWIGSIHSAEDAQGVSDFLTTQ